MRLNRLPLAIAAAASALTFAMSPSFAEKTAETALYANEEEEIVIYPYGVRRESIGRSPLGARVEEISLSRIVSADGLDLRYDGDVDELRRRISYTAQLVCDELDAELRGHSMTTDRQCVRDAVRDAEPQVDALVQRSRW